MSEPTKWVSTSVVARHLGIDRETVPKVAERAGVRRQQLPGMPLRYHLGDVERLARQCVVGSGVPESGLAAAGA